MKLQNSTPSSLPPVKVSLESSTMYSENSSRYEGPQKRIKDVFFTHHLSHRQISFDGGRDGTFMMVKASGASEDIIALTRALPATSLTTVRKGSLKAPAEASLAGSAISLFDGRETLARVHEIIADLPETRGIHFELKGTLNKVSIEASGSRADLSSFQKALPIRTKLTAG